MRLTLAFTSTMGEIAMAVGLLWAFLASTRRADILPGALQDPLAAFSLALAGIAGWQLSQAMLRRMDRSAQLRHAASHSPVAVPGTSAWGDPEKRRRMAGAKAAVGEADQRVERRALGRHIGQPQERVALHPCWPQRRTGSWVGGLPALPASMDWPEVGWTPAPFLAQIALEDMPQDLWQGMGPREGWLAVWADPEDPSGTVVRHVTGPVEERAQPVAVVHDWHWNMAPAGLRAAFGDDGNVPPRWYLEPAPEPALGAVEDMAAEEPGHWDGEKGDYVWAETWTTGRAALMERVSQQPGLRGGVDWPSCFGVMALIEDILVERAAHLECMQPHADGTHAPRTPLAAEELADINRLLPEVRARVARLGDMARETPFDPGLGRATWDLANALPVGLRAKFRPAAQHLMENYARHLYTRDPDSVPKPLFDLFAPLWETQCRETLIFVGRNQPGGGGAQRDARLIDIPTHPLAGLSFGDGSRYWVDLPLASLAAGAWHEARADNTHGSF